MKYTLIKVNNIDIYTARVRRSRSFRLSIKNDGKVYATYPWHGSKKDLLSFIESKISWIMKQQENVQKKIKTHEVRLTKKELAKLINGYLNKYVQLFRADGFFITLNKVSLRQMTTRFGSCTPSKKTIRFSTELCKYSDRFIECVVVHELAHLVEFGHNKRFWSIVKHYIPDYKEIKD